MSNSIFVKDGTAQGVAKQRLIETIAGADKRVINDPYADSFVIGSGFIKLMGHKLNAWLSEKLAPGFHEHLISRTKFIDELIEKSAVNGIEQYVILGAGYDSRAHRLKLPSSMKIFEVDQPEVSDNKLAKLPKELPNSENVTYVNIDFSYQSLTEQLIGAGLDQKKSTIFTLEGVSQYITKEAVSSTIKELASLTKDTNSIFFMSYVDELLDKCPEACFGKGYPNPEKKVNLIKSLSAKVGEPWISFYTLEEIESLLLQNGYSIEENLTLEDLNSLYFGPVGRTLSENQIFKLEHFLVATSKNITE
ncbi:SAM-dependent methyltransferase [Gammaproteobacteria bacterium]|jgi:methyltransferase (TIGR00027 family)|nr:SAM-dependent methyltransferase [Gammaproteobacteria bacterium]|tara:strand:+ start:1763 stop:2680 length:918 start_codon:yes stop_codon:yes gene_type:complete